MALCIKYNANSTLCNQVHLKQYSFVKMHFWVIFVCEIGALLAQLGRCRCTVAPLPSHHYGPRRGHDLTYARARPALAVCSCALSNDWLVRRPTAYCLRSSGMNITDQIWIVLICYYKCARIHSPLVVDIIELFSHCGFGSVESIKPPNERCFVFIWSCRLCINEGLNSDVI